MYIEHGSTSPAASGRCIGICSTPSPRLEREKDEKPALIARGSFREGTSLTRPGAAPGRAPPQK